MFFLLSQFYSRESAAPGSNQCSESEQNRHKRKSYRCGRVPQISDPLADKNLVYNVVDRINQTGNRRRNGKFNKQVPDRLISQRIFYLLIHRLLIR